MRTYPMLGLLPLILLGLAVAAGEQPKGEEWKPMFDGKTLEGWRVTPFTRGGQALSCWIPARL